MNEVVAGRFRITGVLGQGAMGVVYRAYDEVLDRELALKEMRVPSGVEAGEALERFVTEARAAARLSDSSIVTVHDVIQDGDRVLIAMELLEGATLAEALNLVPGGIAPEQVREVMTSVAGALAAAHRQGVVHRDLKPDNIFWLESGRVVVTDFGLARIGAGRGTQVGTVMGTPGYMAPEQIRGDQVAPAADVFAWGAIAHELLVGQPVFGGPESEATTLMWRVVNDPAPVLELPDDPSLAALIDWTLRKDPAERPSDGADLLDALRGGVSHLATPAARQVADRGRPPRPSDATKRSRGMVAGVVGASVLLLATVTTLILVLTGNQPQSVPVTTFGGARADATTRTAPSEPDDSTLTTPPGFDTLVGRRFTVLYPQGWFVKRREERVPRVARHLEDTTITDGADLAIVRVNTTFGLVDNGPSGIIAPVRAELSRRPTYVELAFRPEQLVAASGTYDSIRWEYLLQHPDQDVMLHNVNYFIDAGDFSMALLTRAPVDDFEALREDFDRVREHLVIR